MFFYRILRSPVFPMVLVRPSNRFKNSLFLLSQIFVSPNILIILYSPHKINKYTLLSSFTLPSISFQSYHPMYYILYMQQEKSNLQQQQQKHKHEVKVAFKNYKKDIEQTNSLFTTKTKIPYYKLVQERKREQYKKALEQNQQFLDSILDELGEEEPIEEDEVTTCANISKIRTTVKQFYREWCSESPELRDYFRLVKKVKEYLEIKSRVLVPGCGLGRLVLELVQAGYGAQGNQVTYFMLFGSNFILNSLEEKESIQIYPFIHNSSTYENDSYLRSVRIPDKVASSVVGEDADFSMVAGEFTEIYNQEVQTFNGVVTCFFLDTANNVFNYIDTIANTLKPDGIWINYGPLLYHYKDISEQTSVELSWEQIKLYVQQLFEIIEEKQQESTYCHDLMSTYTPIYRCKLTVCKKKNITNTCK